jgi:hypothetical protein
MGNKTVANTIPISEPATIRRLQEINSISSLKNKSTRVEKVSIEILASEPSFP